MVEESNYLARAQDFFKQAEKKLKPGVFGKMFGNKTDRLDEACELFKQAANYYRLGRDSSLHIVNSSAQAFLKCAECSPDDGANYYMEAGNIIKNVNSTEAVNYYNQAVSQLAVSGRISQAARLRKQIAEIYEQDQNIPQAVENYKQAAELFQMDNSDSTAHNCLLKVAELSTLDSFTVQNATDAIRIFEKVGVAFLAHNLTKYSAKDCFFKASLIFLALDVSYIQDTVGCENKLIDYSNKDPSYETSREAKFIRDLLKAISKHDQAEFEDVVFNFSRITPLDAWRTRILLKAKDHVSKEDELDYS